MTDPTPEPVAVTHYVEAARRIEARVAAGEVDLRDVASLCGEAWDQDLLAGILRLTHSPAAVEADVASVARAIHTFLSRRDIMQYLDNDEDCEGLARVAIAKIRARPAVSDGVEREGAEQHLCGHCGAQYLLMGANYIDAISEALDRAGAPKWSDDRSIMFSLVERIAALKGDDQ